MVQYAQIPRPPKDPPPEPVRKPNGEPPEDPLESPDERPPPPIPDPPYEVPPDPPPPDHFIATVATLGLAAYVAASRG